MSGGSAEDNPINLNVVPMVDIIFCLCVFFMCTYKFKALEVRLQSWLPKDMGNGPIQSETPPELCVTLEWNASHARTLRRFGLRTIQSDEELSTLLEAARADQLRMGQAETPLIIDGAANVPWDEVMNVVNLSKRADITKIQFAAGAGNSSPVLR